MIVITTSQGNSLDSMPRKSKQREAIFETVREANSHPTAEWVYEQVRKEIPNISLGTVYRNLKLLKQAGMISELNFIDNLSRFNGNVQHHYHFKCEQCGNIFDVNEPVNKELDNRLARENGFKVFHHQLGFYGLCKDCQS